MQFHAFVKNRQHNNKFIVFFFYENRSTNIFFFYKNELLSNNCLYLMVSLALLLWKNIKDNNKFLQQASGQSITIWSGKALNWSIFVLYVQHQHERRTNRNCARKLLYMILNLYIFGPIRMPLCKVFRF